MLAPPERWAEIGFDDAAWTQSEGAFGFDHGDRVHTDWKSDDIWLRRAFSLDKDAAGLRLRYDGEVTYYLNGIPAFSAKGDNGLWRYVEIAPDALKAIRTDGPNILAAHARQTHDTAIVDAGIVFIHPPQ